MIPAAILEAFGKIDTYYWDELALVLNSIATDARAEGLLAIADKVQDVRADWLEQHEAVANARPEQRETYLSRAADEVDRRCAGILESLKGVA